MISVPNSITARHGISIPTKSINCYQPQSRALKLMSAPVCPFTMLFLSHNLKFEPCVTIIHYPHDCVVIGKVCRFFFVFVGRSAFDFKVLNDIHLSSFLILKNKAKSGQLCNCMRSNLSMYSRLELLPSLIILIILAAMLWLVQQSLCFHFLDLHLAVFPNIP